MATATSPIPASREFVAKLKDDQGTLKLTVRLPNTKERTASDRAGALAFNKAVEEGFPAIQRVLRTLRKNGIITEEQEKESDRLRSRVRELNERLAKETLSDEVRQEVFAERNAVASEVGLINQEIESYLQFTADAKAKSARETFQIACVIQHAEDTVFRGKEVKKGSRLWSSVEDFENELDEGLASRATYEFFCLENGLPTDWADGAAEPQGVTTTSTPEKPSAPETPANPVPPAPEAPPDNTPAT